MWKFGNSQNADAIHKNCHIITHYRGFPWQFNDFILQCYNYKLGKGVGTYVGTLVHWQMLAVVPTLAHDSGIMWNNYVKIQ